MTMMLINRKMSIIISSEAGQGLRSFERMLLQNMKQSGCHVMSISDVLSRMQERDIMQDQS